MSDLYAPDNLRHAHARNDEVLEHIYIGQRFSHVFCVRSRYADFLT